MSTEFIDAFVLVMIVGPGGCVALYLAARLLWRMLRNYE